MIYFLVSCPPLDSPSNGMITCALEDEVPSYEDTCNFTCDTGYELRGSDNRTCQSDGSWSGIATMCSRGKYMAKLMISVYSCKVDLSQNIKKERPITKKDLGKKEVKSKWAAKACVVLLLMEIKF